MYIHNLLFVFILDWYGLDSFVFPLVRNADQVITYVFIFETSKIILVQNWYQTVPLYSIKLAGVIALGNINVLHIPV